MSYLLIEVKNLTELKTRRGDSNPLLARVLGLDYPTTDAEVLYEWDNASTATGDDNEIIHPTVYADLDGRWLKRQTSADITKANLDGGNTLSGVQIMTNRLSVGTSFNYPTDFRFVFSNGGNEGVEHIFNFDVDKRIVMFYYDRIGAVKVPAHFQASAFNFDAPITASPATLSTHLVTLGQLNTATTRQIVTTSAGTYTIVPTSLTMFLSFTGTTTTATLPTLASQVGAIYFLTNAGSGLVTIQENGADTNKIWEGGIDSNITDIPSGSVTRIINDGVRWRVL